MKLRGINQLLDILLYKSGLHELVHRTEGHTKDKRKETARANGFRKYVITCMAESGVDFEIRESLVGPFVRIICALSKTFRTKSNL